MEPGPSDLFAPSDSDVMLVKAVVGVCFVASLLTIAWVLTRKLRYRPVPVRASRARSPPPYPVDPARDPAR